MVASAAAKTQFIMQVNLNLVQKLFAEVQIGDRTIAESRCADDLPHRRARPGPRRAGDADRTWRKGKTRETPTLLTPAESHQIAQQQQQVQPGDGRRQEVELQDGHRFASHGTFSNIFWPNSKKEAATTPPPTSSKNKSRHAPLDAFQVLFEGVRCAWINDCSCLESLCTTAAARAFSAVAPSSLRVS
jgi:hypothetical protein